jgi:hypothetical protein
MNRFVSWFIISVGGFSACSGSPKTAPINDTTSVVKINTVANYTQLGNSIFEFQLLPDYSISEETRIHGRVYYLEAGTNAAIKGTAGFYIGGSPNIQQPDSDHTTTTFAGQLLGKSTNWTQFQAAATNPYVHREAIVPLHDSIVLQAWCNSSETNIERLFDMITSIRLKTSSY